jgi:long-chain fatty acid transport protein
MASMQLTERLAIGAGPVITAGTPSFNPAFFAPSKGPLGLPTFPAGTNARPYWGGGFQVGLLYELNDDWNLGFSYKSPIWQERWDFNAATPTTLVPRRIGIQASLPQMLSWGVAYKGLARTLIALDLRYIDYADSELFGQKVIDGGLGWRSVFVVALGAQYEATDRLTLRGGYLYNTNPIPNPVTLFNAQAPGIITNTLTMGASYELNENVTASLAWMHGFRNSIQGPILQIPGSTVRIDAQVDTLWAGVNIKFGGQKRKGGGGIGAMTSGSGSGSSNIPPPASWSSPDAPATPDAGWPEIPMPMPAIGPAGGASAAPNVNDAAATAADAGGLPQLP